MLMVREKPASARNRRLLLSLRFQILIVFTCAVGVWTAFHFSGLLDSRAVSLHFNSVVGASIGSLIGLVCFRRVTAFPGTRAFGYILPSFLGSYGAVVLAMFGARLDYSRFYIGASFVSAVVVTYALSFMIERYVRPRFYLVPFGDANDLANIQGVDWEIMKNPVVPRWPGAALVADLRFDLDPQWERILAQAAIGGHPVYHTKQIRESITGQVSMEHLSENSFGSLLPNLVYVKIKRVTDLVGCALLLPLLALPMLIIALLIKLDSDGPVIFKQQRMGYRGEVFTMYKFRTMKVVSSAEEMCSRQISITRPKDDRITSVGSFLRKVRFDEIPQLWNVVRGEMSIIGPRPEAVPLSRWYETELPFYVYRHIVRPGLTGWAQVQQGHVTNLHEVNQKLSYDFYYIKNFSAWLDILIALRTVPTMLSGYGSK